MILTLRVDDFLRGAVAIPTRDLLTRPTGAAVRGRIVSAIAAAEQPTACLDFGAVGLIDFSCADEVVAKLLRVLATGRYVVLRGLDDTHAEAIHYVLARQELSVVVVPRDGGWDVLGYATPDMRAVLEVVYAEGPGDTDRVARRLDWTPERAADALQTLALRRLVLAAGGTFAPLPVQ